MKAILHPTLKALCGFAILSACAGPTARPGALAPAALNAQGRGRAQAGIEQQVDRERMSKHLAVLTGKAPVGAEGLIPERGGSQGRALTRAYLVRSLEALGYKPEQQAYRPTGTNVFTRLMAATPSNEYILLGAHMDSVRNAGADDNASGSVAVLEAAAVLKNLPGRKVNVLFAWFDEEEIGLVGSRYLAKEFKKQGLRITSMHNIDMLGWDADKDKTIEVAQPDGILWDYYNMVNKSHGLNLPFDRSNTGQSDHESFHAEGFPSVCISEEYTSGDLTPHYHRKGDVFETINLDYLTLGTKLVVAVAGDLSQGVPAPANIQRLPNSRFPARQRHLHASYDEFPH